MAVVNVLPNGMILITVSPRDAVMLCDEILDPADFPWQSTESQMLAMDVKAQVKHIVEEMQHRRAEMVKSMIPAEQPPQPPPPSEPVED